MANYSTDAQREWERTRSKALRSDVIWKLDVYRAALYFRHLTKADCREIRRLRPGEELAEQLGESAGSIGANIAEGYSRSTRADRLRFYGYSLGSTRECIVWYEDAREDFPSDLCDERQDLLARIRALMLGLIAQQRPGREFEP